MLSILCLWGEKAYISFAWATAGHLNYISIYISSWDPLLTYPLSARQSQLLLATPLATAEDWVELQLQFSTISSRAVSGHWEVIANRLQLPHLLVFCCYLAAFRGFLLLRVGTVQAEARRPRRAGHNVVMTDAAIKDNYDSGNRFYFRVYLFCSCGPASPQLPALPQLLVQYSAHCQKLTPCLCLLLWLELAQRSASALQRPSALSTPLGWICASTFILRATNVA